MSEPSDSLLPIQQRLNASQKSYRHIKRRRLLGYLPEATFINQPVETVIPVPSSVRADEMVEAAQSAQSIEFEETVSIPAYIQELTEAAPVPASSLELTKNTPIPEFPVDFTDTTRIPAHPAELINTLRVPQPIPHLKKRKPSTNHAETAQPEKSNARFPYLKRVMSPQQRATYFVLIGIWVGSLIFFWNWWLRPERVITLAGMITNSLVLLWSTVLPGYYFFFVARMHEPDPSLPLPDGRVAIIVTKAPSEPWPVLQKTLEAMKAQQFPRPFDVWLADESPSEETFKWCIDHGIWVSCRKDMPGYQNDVWPRRQKSKEGNLSYFYDSCGYRQYDFVAQLDADHVPEPDYLYHMIAPFYDPAVGYVAAPSICDANASSSWLSRARLYAEAGLHGAMQAGHSFGFAPLCIGSHYAVRTSALQEIGGLGPELAEDHSTTLLFNAHGWRGVFAFKAFAHGDGAECLADSVTQEFQWSRSLTKLLFTLTPRYWKHLPLRLKIQFFFAQLWYPLSSGNMMTICLLPFVALLTGTSFVNVIYPDFLLHFMGTTLACMLLVVWIQRQGWLRPINARVLSWETTVFPLLMWPWMLQGVIHAVISVILKKELSFRVTPKGRTGVRPLPNSVLLPYTLIVVFTFIYAIVLQGGQAQIYHWFATTNILTYTFIIWVAVIGHVYDNRMHDAGQVLSVIKGSLWQVCCVTVLATIDLQLHFSDILALFFIR